MAGTSLYRGVLIALAVVNLIVLLAMLGSDSSTFFKSRLSRFSLQSCQLNGPTNTTDVFAKHYRHCIATYLPQFNFEYFRMGRFNEKKVFLPLVRNTSAARDCIFLTIGIGGDTLVEQEFKIAYPDCQVYGMEPSPDQVKGFDKFGTVIPYGVGVRNETLELALRIGSEYDKKKVKVVALSTLLDAYVKTRFIHYATMDIEGAEFPILEALLPGGQLYDEGIVICQMDVELHGFHPEFKEVISVMKNYSSPASQYISVVNTDFLHHQKVTFVNVKNDICREAFNLTAIGL